MKLRLTTTRVVLGVLASGFLVLGLVYRYVTTGGMSARQKPSAAEAFFAGELVQLGIDREARERKNPLGSVASGAGVAGGRHLYQRGVTCHDAHGSDHPSSLRKPASALCLDGHGAGSANGPRTPTLAEHTHHEVDSAGSECISWHMPRIAQTIGDVNVRRHTFRFVSPAQTDSAKTPNACNACDADHSTAWATNALKSWTERSPWRMTP